MVAAREGTACVARHALADAPTWVIAALDESSAFQLAQRPEMRRRMMQHLPEFVPYFSQAYDAAAALHYGDERIPAARSANGCRHGCSLEGTRSADCYHWSAMTYGRHWRHRMAVILGRGRVTCLRRSADKGFGGSDVFTAEVAPDSL